MKKFIINLPQNTEKKLSGEINIILAGQSNATGRACINGDGEIPPDIGPTGYVEDAYYFENDNTFHEYTRDMNYQTDHVGEWSVEYRVAKDIITNNPDVTRVNLLKYSVGGQAVTGGCWAENAYCTNGLIEAYALTGKTFEYMIWIQGESDSVTLEVANQYYDNCTATFTKILAGTNPNMTILPLTLAHCVPCTPSLPYMYVVNQALSDMGRDMANVNYVYVPEMTAGQVEYEQHYNNSGIEILASYAYNYIIDLINT